VRELLEGQSAAGDVPAQEGDGLVALEIGGAEGWSLVAQGSRSLYCDRGSVARSGGRRRRPPIVCRLPVALQTRCSGGASSRASEPRARSLDRERTE
jgi:hypothetical protein